MSRFANPNATDRLVLGDCECPGKPHAEDWIMLRTELGGYDFGRLLAGNSVDTLEILATSWNLLDDSGDLAPLDREHIDALFTDYARPLTEWVQKHLKLLAAPLPNASGARSRRGTRESASPAPTTLTNGSSTTPSWQPVEPGVSGTSSTPPPTS